VADSLNTAQPDDVETGVRLFQERCSADYERLAFADATDIREKRRIAEAVRAPWAAGGPEMAQSADRRVGDMNVRVRLHQPAADPTLPVLIYIHGGGWMLFSVDSHDRLMREYAARARVTVIGVDYSLAPEAQFPVPLDEILSVVRWLRGDVSKEGIAPARIAIGGDSAGANLAIGTNLALKKAGEQLLDAQLLNYGAFDPDPRPSRELFGGPSYALTSDEMDEFWANYLPTDRRDDPLARPLLAELRGLPATYLCIAECDILADENREMGRALEAEGVPVTMKAYAGATHSFLEAVSVSMLSDRALEDGSNWLADVLRQ
jgi:acetyl esterase